MGSSPSPLLQDVVCPLHVNFSTHPCICLEVNIDIIVILIGSFFSRCVPFAPENYCWLHCVLSPCPDAKLECCLSLVQARSWLRNSNLFVFCNFMCVILIHDKRQRSILGRPSTICIVHNYSFSSPFGLHSLPLPSLAVFFFLVVLLLTEMLYLRLNR